MSQNEVILTRTNPNLARRIRGLVRAINEEMQPGSREFCLAAVAELVDERDALYTEREMKGST